MEQSWVNAGVGGLVIGFSAGLFLLLYGRVLGVSGITGRIFEFNRGDTFWRLTFVVGLIVGGGVASYLWPEQFAVIQGETLGFLRLACAGFIVGYGTKLGSGCTSGHGVCGVGRLSPRSIIATMVFISTGMLTVFFWGKVQS